MSQRDDDVVTAYTAGTGAPPPAYPGQPRNVHADRLPTYVAPKANLAAKAGIVFALFGLVTLAPVGSLLAIVLGMIGLSVKDKSLYGRKLALTSILVGALGIALALLAGVFESRRR